MLALASRLLRLSLTAAVVLAASRAEAGGYPEARHRVLPCRPTIACTADIVEPGALEIEAGWLARRVRSAGFQHAQPILVTLSVSRWFQLQLGTNGRIFSTGDVQEPAGYFDGASAGIKAHFLDQTDALPALAVSLALRVPSWDRPRGVPFALDATLWGYATKDLGVLHVDLNAALSALRVGGGPAWQPLLAIALSVPLGTRFGAMVEGYDFGAADAVAPPDAGVLGALTFSPRPWVMFDAGVDTSFFPSTRAHSLFLGVTAIPWVFSDGASPAVARANGPASSPLSWRRRR